MSEPIIKIENLSKRYRIGTAESYSSLRDSFAGMFKFGKSNPTSTDFWALRDINLKIEKGETFGIIGRNGAGKSTLLKILSQITPPTSGKITMKGRVASLLEVGTGFHQELTGRENIYLNGAILGMTRKEISQKFDEIIAFSEVEKFLDTPVKRYSSGMYVRLAFAVAAHLEPEILIVDEVLAVGDMQFQKKCLGKMQNISAEGGRTVIFVSHNMAAVSSLCNRALLLNNGRIEKIGLTASVIDEYTSMAGERTGPIMSHLKVEDSSIRVLSASANGVLDDLIRVGTNRIIDIEFEINVESACSVSVETKLFDDQGNTIGICAPGPMHGESFVIHASAGKHKLSSRIILPCLHKGIYYLEPRITHPGIKGYAVFPMAIKFDWDGYPLKGGAVFEKNLSGNGFELIDGTVSLS